MSAKIGCDVCGSMELLHRVGGWVQVGGIGHDISTFGQESLPVDLCSLECLLAWVKDAHNYPIRRIARNPKGEGKADE